MDDRTVPRIRGHPARGEAQVPDEPSAQKSTFARWGGRVFSGVIGAGALAGAITAVLALRPINEEDFAEFKTVTVTSGVPYSEYQQRSVPPHPVPQSLGRGKRAHAPILVAAAPGVPTEDAAGAKLQGTSSVTPSATTRRTMTSGTNTPDVTTEPSATPTPASRLLNRPAAAASDSMRLALPGDVSPLPSRTVYLIRSQCPRTRITGCTDVANGLVQLPFTDLRGNSLPAEEVSKEILAVIKGSRTTSAGKGKKQLVGAVVDVNVELSGLRGKPVVLSWSLWRKGGTKQIYRAWLNDNLAYELKAGSDRDSASLNFWIPLPKGKGPYIVRSKLTMDGSALATVDSEPIT